MTRTAEILYPITEFSPPELGRRFSELVAVNKSLLVARHILGPLRRYCDPETAEQSIMRAQAIHNDNAQIFVPVGVEGDPEGIATLTQDLKLKRLQLPIPLGLPDHSSALWLRRRSESIDRLANKQWWVDLNQAKPNLTAWTSAGQEELLGKAYQALEALTVSADRPWTIEPRRSPGAIHEAILTTRMGLIATRRFDDEESRREITPRSKLYARLHDDKWFTPYGKLRELREGAQSWMTITNDMYRARIKTGGTNMPSPPHTE